MKTSHLITVCAAAALMLGVYVLGYKDGMRGEDAPVLASVQAAEEGTSRAKSGNIAFNRRGYVSHKACYSWEKRWRVKKSKLVTVCAFCETGFSRES